MKTIAITGVSGFVGGRLAQYLARRGYRVIGFGRRKITELAHGDERLWGNENQSVGESKRQLPEYHSWDITKGPLLLAPKVDAVIHCAGSVTEWGRFDEMYQVNVQGTCNVLASFPTKKQFIHLSTASVYDPFRPKHLVTEDAPYPDRYLNEYSHTKQLAEVVVRRNASFSRVIVRPHIVYGPHDTTLLPRLMRARKLGRFVVIGPGQNQLSLTYIDNLGQALALILEQHESLADLEIFNITDERTDTLDNILKAFVVALGLPDKLLHLDYKIAQAAAWTLQTLYRGLRLRTAPLLTPYVVAQMASEYTLDITRAKQKLGYQPAYDYPAGFAQLKCWLDSDQQNNFGRLTARL